MDGGLNVEGQKAGTDMQPNTEGNTKFGGFSLNF
jgi:hypothetical protein